MLTYFRPMTGREFEVGELGCVKIPVLVPVIGGHFLTLERYQINVDMAFRHRANRGSVTFFTVAVPSMGLTILFSAWTLPR